MKTSKSAILICLARSVDVAPVSREKPVISVKMDYG